MHVSLHLRASGLKSTLIHKKQNCSGELIQIGRSLPNQHCAGKLKQHSPRVSNVTGLLALPNSNARLLTASAKPEIAAATLSKPFTHVCPQAIKLLSFVSEGMLGWRMDLPDENPINPNGQGDSNEDTPKQASKKDREDRWMAMCRTGKMTR